MNHHASIEKAIEHIESNVNTRVSVAELARVVGYSPCYFHRIFREYTGENIASFCKRIRLEYTASLLVDSDLNITEIARESGYETPSSFCKAFKQMFDLSPREYQQAKRLKRHVVHHPKTTTTSFDTH